MKATLIALFAIARCAAGSLVSDNGDVGGKLGTIHQHSIVGEGNIRVTTFQHPATPVTISGGDAVSTYTLECLCSKVGLGTKVIAWPATATEIGEPTQVNTTSAVGSLAPSESHETESAAPSPRVVTVTVTVSLDSPPAILTDTIPSHNLTSAPLPATTFTFVTTQVQVTSKTPCPHHDHDGSRPATPPGTSTITLYTTVFNGTITEVPTEQPTATGTNDSHMGLETAPESSSAARSDMGVGLLNLLVWAFAVALCMLV